MINDGYRGSFRNCGAQTFAGGSMHPQPPASDDQGKGNPNMASFERLCYPGASVIVYALPKLGSAVHPDAHFGRAARRSDQARYFRRRAADQRSGGVNILATAMSLFRRFGDR